MNVSLSSVLLFVLLTPFIMTYRLSSEVTPYTLFGLLFLGLLFSTILDIFFQSKKIYLRLKYIAVWFIIVASIGAAFFSAIVVRHRVAPVYMVHDIVLQQESAIQFLLAGKNPYAVTYFGTPLEEWNYGEGTNPALYHFVMQPFYLLFSLPFYFLSITFFGFFDGRIPLYILFFILLSLSFLLVKEAEKKLLFVTLLAFNPAMLPYTLEGRSDMFMFPLLFLSWYLLHKNRLLISGVPMALAFATKQSVWPILPFYIAYVFFQSKSISKTVKELSLFVVTFLVVTLPFFLWNMRAFLDSTVFYLSGTVAHSYPISGYGLGMVLNQFGVIKNLNSYYPFFLWQLVIGVPLMVILLRYFKKSHSVKRLIVIYGIFLFVFWYLSRYFNNSHVSYLSTVFITAFFWPESESTKRVANG